MSGHHGASIHGVSIHGLYQPGQSYVHSLNPTSKVLGLVSFVTLVALTPRTAVAALSANAVVVALVMVVTKLPARMVLGRLAAVVPFVAFGLLLPFIGTGTRVHVGALSLSVDGLWASWNIVAKAIIGASAAIAVTSTTAITDLLSGLERLKVPAVLVAIAAFMVRYVDLVVGELARMRIAMMARGHDPRWLWQIRPIAASLGSLFVRTYERGERIHLAMLSRGYVGSLPVTRDVEALRTSELCVGLLPAAIACSGLAIVLWT